MILPPLVVRPYKYISLTAFVKFLAGQHGAFPRETPLYSVVRIGYYAERHPPPLESVETRSTVVLENVTITMFARVSTHFGFMFRHSVLPLLGSRLDAAVLAAHLLKVLLYRPAIRLGRYALSRVLADTYSWGVGVALLALRLE